MYRPLTDIARVRYVRCEPPVDTPRAWLHTLMFDWGIIVHGERNTAGWPAGTTTAPARSVVLSWESDAPTVRIADVPVALYAEHNVVLQPLGVDRFYLAGLLMAHHSEFCDDTFASTLDGQSEASHAHPATAVQRLQIPEHCASAQRRIGQRARVLTARAHRLEEATAAYLQSLERLTRDVMKDVA